ncbi:unnamed protein product [Oikopleura dioica]|uniref:Uncharacterized protein n=1 Tax=Oikopleura dioica TaxID=34765 RepID=E4Y290_OIKDI|nr:unnamed protein product [Oikopleura dioica]
MKLSITILVLINSLIGNVISRAARKRDQKWIKILFEIAKEEKENKENWETAEAVLETRANEDGEDGSGDSEVR